MSMELRNAKFDIGAVVVTPAAATALLNNNTALDDLLGRHQSGDWGEVSEPLRCVNERGLSEGFNLQSTYTLADGTRLVVVTNRDRQTTLIHLDAH